MNIRISLILAGLIISACNDSNNSVTNLNTGQELFKQNCAECHGDKAQGLIKDWRQPLANGKYPAPPLNGSAHTWHHSPEQLLRTIDNGGTALGGWMPGFKDKLSHKQKLKLIDYIYNLWPEDIKNAYDARFK